MPNYEFIFEVEPSWRKYIVRKANHERLCSLGTDPFLNANLRVAEYLSGYRTCLFDRKRTEKHLKKISVAKVSKVWPLLRPTVIIG